MNPIPSTTHDLSTPAGVLQAISRLPEPYYPDFPTTKIDVEYSAVGLASGFDHLGIEIRFNTRASVIEHHHGNHPWRRFEGGDRDVLRGMIHESCTFAKEPKPDGTVERRKARWSISEFDSHLSAVSAKNKVDPFLEWLRKLPPWDGKPRLDSWLPTILPVRPGTDPEYLAWASRSVLLAAVQRTLRPGSKHDHVVLLIGPQGALKSTAWQLLVPPEHFNEWFSDGLDLRERRKDMTESGLGKVIVEVSEFTTRADQLERMKAWVRQRDDGVVRLAYRPDPIPTPRQFVIVGTTNTERPLPRDPSGNRVFSPIHVGFADQVKLYRWMNKNRCQLWAEAWARRSEQAWMAREMEQGIQAAYALEDQSRDEVAEEYVNFYLESHDPEQLFTMNELLDWMQKNSALPEPKRSQSVGQILRAKGYTKDRERRNGQRGIYWFKTPPAETETPSA